MSPWVLAGICWLASNALIVLLIYLRFPPPKDEDDEARLVRERFRHPSFGFVERVEPWE